MQDERGCLMQHGTPTYHIHASSHLPPIEEDYALAIRLQEDELEQYSARHPQASAQDPECPEDQPQPQQRRRKRRVCSLLNVLLLVASAGMVAVYILALWQGGWQIQGLSVNPMVGPSGDALSRLGSKVSSKISDQNQWWRLVTSLFVSSGVIQLFSAVTSLWTLAKYLEHSQQVLLPSLTIPLLYLVSGIAGCILSANMAFDHNSTGSSAAVSGLLGGVWVEQLLNFKVYRNHVLTYLILIILTGMFVVISLLPLVGLWFQVSAMVCGALLMPCLLRHPADAKSKRGWVCLKWLLRYSAALVVVAVIAVGVVSLVLNDAAIARSCHGCTDIDCVQIRDWWSCSSLTTLKPQASCLFAQNSNATTTITCPSGFSHLVASNSITDQIASCNTACSTAATFSAPVAGPNDAGVLI